MGASSCSSRAHGPCCARPGSDDLDFHQPQSRSEQDQSEEDTFQRSLGVDSLHADPDQHGTKTVKDVSCSSKEHIYVVGGETSTGFLLLGSADSSVGTRYFPDEDRWEAAPSLLEGRCGAGCAVVEQGVLAMGGRRGSGGDYLRSAELLDLSQGAAATQRWEPVAAMSGPRGFCASAGHQGAAYACGGHDGTSILNSCERFEAWSGRWCPVASMQERRMAAVAGVLGDGLFVAGGACGTSLNCTECLDVLAGRWHKTAPMLERRKAAAAAVACSCLYVIGGTGDGAFLSSGERFDPREGYFTALPPMKQGRQHHAAVAGDAELFVLGGHDGQARLASVECFDLRAGQWRELAASLEAPRALHLAFATLPTTRA